MKKLIFIDSDETLRKTDGTISERTKQAIKKIKEQGHLVIICTGRPRYHTIEIMKEVKATPIIISSNGSEIYDVEKDKIIGNVFLDKKECFELFELSYKNNLRIVFTIDNLEYVTQYTKNDNQVLLDLKNYKEILKEKNIKQCMILYENKKDIVDIEKYISLSNKIRIINGSLEVLNKKYEWLSIGSVYSSKGNALKKLSEYLKISKENTIAIGNDYNDISMLDEAGFSIAVFNAYDEVKKHSDYITKSNDEDGVALVLEKILKKMR